MSPQRPLRDRALAIVAFLGSALLVAFWGLYLGGRIVLGEPGSAALAYEAAFPFADLLAAALLALAGAGLWRGHPVGGFAMTAAASMVLYLGISWGSRPGAPAAVHAWNAGGPAIPVSSGPGGESSRT
jgi:hypothetical protein